MRDERRTCQRNPQKLDIRVISKWTSLLTVNLAPATQPGDFSQLRGFVHESLEASGDTIVPMFRPAASLGQNQSKTKTQNESQGPTPNLVTQATAAVASFVSRAP